MSNTFFQRVSKKFAEVRSPLVTGLMQTIPAYHGYLLENIRYFYNQIAQFANAVL